MGSEVPSIVTGHGMPCPYCGEIETTETAEGFVDRVSLRRIDWNCVPVPAGKRSMINRLGMGMR